MIVDGRFEARVGSVVFRGGFGPEPGLYVSEVDGLLSGGEVRYDDIPWGFGPGVHDTESRREDPRVITLRGLIVGASSYDLGKRIDQLGALLGESTDRSEFTWVEFDDWRRVTVRRGAGWSIVRNRATGTASFVVRFRAPDQRIYGAETTSLSWAAVVSGDNRGGYPAPVSFEVRGSSPDGWTVAGPRGAVIVVARSITPGSIHRYTGDTGLLEIDGVPQMTGVIRSDRIELPPGGFTLAVNNGCEIRATYASTWAP